MESFLGHIADTYLREEHDNMIDYCFVFPNKRSGTFFKHLLERGACSPLMLPHITTITELVYDLTDGVEASRMEQLFMLYNIYKSFSSEIGDFDKFQFWGEMLLNDFNDVDRYMVDASQLFTNVQRLKEIGANYLTEEQVEIIRRFWGEDRVDDAVERFWTHVPGNSGSNSLSDRFLRLWEILYEIYTEFQRQLRDRGMCYAGMAYRDAVEKLRQVSAADLTYRRYVFVGFNVLSTSEIAMFRRLQRMGVADFYWDFNSPALAIPHNKASRFIGRYVEQFTPLYDIGEEPITTLPDIRIIAVPSNIGQVKEVGRLLGTMVADGSIRDPSDAIDTAVVLPDEELFIPLIDALPPEIGDINITMGYPLKHTSVAALLSDIVSMQLRSRKVHGEIEFFHDDVLSVLSHPLLRAIAGDACEGLSRYMTDHRLYNLPAGIVDVQFPQLKSVFSPIRNLQESDAVFAYTGALLAFVGDGAGSAGFDVMERSYISKYQESLGELQRLARLYGISMADTTFFHLLQRALAGESISFEGEPLKGLQVMGVLETRALDFDNVIMLSMNERIFPRKHFARSFIPDALRRGYGLSTIEFQESIFAYYFYRLIARARNVYLFFDARNSGLRSGEMSRYLYQLRYMFPTDRIRYFSGKYPVEPPVRRQIEVVKTPEVMVGLRRLLDPESGQRLSASVINRYINCPLAFYLERVADIHVADPIKDYMDESSLGTVVHHVAETVYKDLLKESGRCELVVTSELLDSLSADVVRLHRQITRSVNKTYHHRDDNELDTPLSGEAKLLGKTILYMLRSFYREEKQFAPFTFVDAEYKVTLPLAVTDDLKVNFTMTIDRIDRRDGTLRLIDYKTGNDPVEFQSVEQLFDPVADNRPKAVFQLMLYACAYSEFTGYDGPIQPYVYQLKRLNTDHLPPLTLNKVPLTDYREIKAEFQERFRGLIKEMFDPEVPFVQAANEHVCAYCQFAKICKG